MPTVLRILAMLVVLAVTGCATSGFSVRFTTAEYQGRDWSLRADEPTPQRGTGGTKGWRVQSADGPRASWFYTESINEWPPERALLLLALEDAPGSEGSDGSWQAAWEKPGVVARAALAQVADVRWLGEPVRELAAFDGPEGAPQALRGDGVELERLPALVRSKAAFGASLSGGFFVKGHVVCRREARAPLIACALGGLASEDEPGTSAADFTADPDLVANVEWLTGYVKSLRLTRR